MRADFEFLRDLHVDPLVKSFLHESESASGRWQDLLQHDTRPTLIMVVLVDFILKDCSKKLSMRYK